MHFIPLFDIQFKGEEIVYVDWRELRTPWAYTVILRCKANCCIFLFESLVTYPFQTFLLNVCEVNNRHEWSRELFYP